MLPLIALCFGVLLITGYHLYGRWVERQFGTDDSRRTPAHLHADGVDYVPTTRSYLFAQHFSAIAAAGPIAGPILACQTFGWLPCLLWIGLGVVLIGAVHDFSALTASVRHDARSVAEIAREHLGGPAGRAMLAFILLALIYVIVAFTNITASSFVSGTEELAGETRFNPGGAVAAASIMYLLLAVVMGLVQRFLKPPLWLLTLVFVPATFAVCWYGTQISELLVLDYRFWAVAILAYCALASLAPVWLLLQPRGYLGGYVLYAALACGVIGIFFGGYEIQQPHFKTWFAPEMTGALFPFLFVTIACGACSGFHGLVCGGTTSKQVDRESHLRSIGYGAMLAEGFVALIALVTVMIAASGDLQGKSAGQIYGGGIGQFMTLIVGEQNLRFAITFGTMAFSTFVFDTLDVSTRLGRYIVQELFSWRGRSGAFFGTLFAIGAPLVLVVTSDQRAWTLYWTLFGASNQLLAALTLLVVAVWLRKLGKSAKFALIPMLFVLLMTIWALVKIVIDKAGVASTSVPAAVNATTAALLLALAVYLIVMGLKSVWALHEPPALPGSRAARPLH